MIAEGGVPTAELVTGDANACLRAMRAIGKWRLCEGREYLRIERKYVFSGFLTHPRRSLGIFARIRRRGEFLVWRYIGRIRRLCADEWALLG